MLLYLITSLHGSMGSAPSTVDCDKEVQSKPATRNAASCPRTLSNKWWVGTLDLGQVLHDLI